MAIKLEENLEALLKKLAAEEETTADELIKKLIEDEDKKRHLLFVPGKDFQRFKCGRDKCFETAKRPRPGYGN